MSEKVDEQKHQSSGSNDNSKISDDSTLVITEDSGTQDTYSKNQNEEEIVTANDSDKAALLAKIAKLEAANKELVKERDTFKNSIVINTNDVYANLKQLQVNFAEKAANGYEAMRNSVPDRGNYGFDLRP